MSLLWKSKKEFDKVQKGNDAFSAIVKVVNWKNVSSVAFRKNKETGEIETEVIFEEGRRWDSMTQTSPDKN